ncbi:hypothetical protein B296_00016827 [Ensete ventricosum]|uniref:Uncharacterized protein n=1 Tax=Ensete ventricosum TaxID=4639 RepID=A0A426Y9Y2_ENSVE|nr:hypothetical protein B296_00016827 [Ensete ventricosum]
MQGDVSSPRAGRKNRPRATDRTMSAEIQVLLFFFLPPSAKIARNWSTTVEIDHYQLISRGNGQKQPLPVGTTGSGRSAYRSTGGLARIARYGALLPVEEKKLNATYIITVARKLGCSVFLLPEDIIEGGWNGNQNFDFNFDCSGFILVSIDSDTVRSGPAFQRNGIASANRPCSEKLDPVSVVTSYGSVPLSFDGWTAVARPRGIASTCAAPFPTPFPPPSSNKKSRPAQTQSVVLIYT